MSVLDPVLAPAEPDVFISTIRCGMEEGAEVIRCGGHLCGEQDPLAFLIPRHPEEL